MLVLEDPPPGLRRTPPSRGFVWFKVFANFVKKLALKFGFFSGYAFFMA
jgi:hypothetical protein